MVDDNERLSTLLVYRRGARHLAEEDAGYAIEIPSMAFPNESPPDIELDWEDDPEVLVEHLDWPDPRRAGVEFDVVEPAGMLAPSEWETFFLEWVAELLDAELEMSVDRTMEPLADGPEPTRPAVSKLTRDDIDPWEGPEKFREDTGTARTVLRRAETARGEARETAARVREWLTGGSGGIPSDAADHLDDVLVLLPDDADLLDLWRGEFERADLPVRAPAGRPLAETGAGRSLVDLARLADWAEESKPRPLLRRVFEGPYWSANRVTDALSTSAPENASLRKTLRRTLREVRGDSVELEDWRRQLVDHATDNSEAEYDGQQVPPEAQLSVKFTDELVDLFSEPAEVFRRLQGALEEGGALGLHERLHPRDAEAVAGGLSDALSALARRERMLDDGEEDEELEAVREGDLQPADLLQRTLAKRGVTVGGERASEGVTLLPARLYDGRNSDLLFVAGMGEGVYPAVPNRWAGRELEWVEALGFDARLDGGADESTYAAFAHDYIDRHAQLIARATEGCHGPVTYSYHTTTDVTDEAPPGPVLTLLVGGWDDEAWTEGASETAAEIDAVTWADEVPDGPTDACSRRELYLFADDIDSEELEAVEPVADGPPGPAVAELASRVREMHRRLRPSRLAAEARDPARGVDLGPRTGRLPGAFESPESYSSSALEDYGQCGAKYFFGRGLGLDEPEDVGDAMAPKETGNAIHDAFFRAADQQIDSDGESPTPWALVYDAEEVDKEEFVDTVVGTLADQLEATFREVLEENPGLQEQFEQARADRWKRAVEEWVKGHVEPEVDLSPGAIELSEEAGEEWLFERRRPERNELEAELEQTLDSLDSLREFLQGLDSFPSQSDCDEFRHDNDYLTRDGQDLALADVARAIKAEEAIEAGLHKVDEYEDKAHETYEEELEELCDDIRGDISDELDNRRTRINHYVLHAELAFKEKKYEGVDPASLDDAVEVDLPDGNTIQVSGKIDRVDYDPGAEAVAIRDYKSGSSSSSGSFDDEIPSGEHVQLPLYAVAVESATEAGEWPHLEGAEARFASLEFPKEADEESVRLDEEALVDSETGESLDFRDAVRQWVAHHVDGIERGLFPAMPKSCPIEEEYGAYCDYEKICAVKGDPLDEAFDDPRNTPAIEPDEEDSDGGSDEDSPEWSIVPRAEEPVDDETLWNWHAEAEDAVRDLDQNVVVAAGAGTGKTYSLVLRYLEALADGVTPDEVLCVTFTRKAAAEMTQRIRKALLEGLHEDADSEEMQEAVERIMAEGGEQHLRRIVFQLSAAPISTIDSLAGDILRAAEELEDDSATDADYEIVTGEAAADEVERFVGDRFFEALAEGDARLDYLLGEITPSKLREYLVTSVQNYTPRSEFAGSSVDKLEDELLDSWNRLDAHLGGDNVEQDELEQKARTTARLVSLAGEWSEKLRDQMRERGRLRYEDVLQLAIDRLQDEELRDDLAAEFPFRHIFVDELQDTSEGQVEMLSELADVAGHAARVGEPRQFWVGDRKQSIFRFRNAEVDIFENRVEEARESDEWTVAQLTENRRSRPELIEAIDALFSRLHPAGWSDDEETSEDPGTEIDYEPLSWPKKDGEGNDGPDLEGPPVELLATPEKGWPRNFDEDEEPEELLRDGVARRVGSLLEEAEQEDIGTDGAPVAVLVSTWSDAETYRDALADYGIGAVIEGGSGLLERRESLVLRRWLEAAAFPDHETALVAALQGPGFGCSEAGLYCLKQGWGVAPKDPDDSPWSAGSPPSLKAAIRFGELDADEALDAWEEAVGEVDREEAREVLAEDARVLERFQREFDRLRNRLGFEPTADLLEELVERAALRPFWHGRDDGRQRVANIDRFLDVVRGIEADGGISPRRVHRQLEQMAGDDDPAAGGLAASRDADVVVTSYWQAKGREWPVVVLPEVHRTKASPDYPVGPARLTMRNGPDEPPEVVYTSDIKTTPDDDPFDTDKTKVSDNLVRPHRKMAARAENRRLLYVAMTRAEDKVVMAGKFQRYRSQKHDPVRLEHAKRWSSAIYLAGGLVFEDGKPQLDPEGGWGEPEGFDVCVKGPEEVDEFDGLEDRDDTSPDPDADRLAGLADRLRPVDSGTLRRASISAAEPPEDGVPEPDEVVEPTSAPELPDDRPFGDDGRTGDVFHRGMELWAFDEDRPDAEVWRQALDEYGVAVGGDREAYVAYLETLLDRLLAFEDLTSELREARDRGELYPELPVRFPADGENDGDTTLYRGLVDLVWRDPEGRLHLLDYKTGHDPRVTGGDITEDNKLPEHYAQIATYRRGLERVVDEVASAGLWFPKAGVVVKWGRSRRAVEPSSG